MAKKGNYFFENRGGEGPLSIYIEPGPYGLAVDANEGSGVGFFSDKKKLLAVIFDHVNEIKDHQILKFPEFLVELNVNKKRINYHISKSKQKKVA